MSKLAISKHGSPYLRILDKEYNDSENGVFTSEPHDFGFELDHFQKHAIMATRRGENVLVTAHTGSGKTVPAIFAIADSLSKNKKIIYTSPIKSLSNQKLFELKRKFPDVGILTGDIKFNPDAQCVIMTTEILRNILYQKESQHIDIAEVDKVIFDEVHYINDPDRGRVWEECMILMPRDITLVMLSATIDKADEFASWIGNIKQKITNWIPTKCRVVPLEHYFFLEHLAKPLVKIADSARNFVNYNQIKQDYQQVTSSYILNKMVDYLKEHQMAPALFFVFSRKECEKLAKGVHRSVITSEESAEISKIWEYELRHYRKIYEKSRQYQELYNLLLKGIAYHHSGLIPVLKEVIEILFEKGLVKLLFATETFAVGVNAPTKTVIFPRLTKYSNGGFRYLRTDEYLQMAGRAGRRGLDPVGRVIIIPLDELMDYAPLKKMLTGKSPSIVSKFRLNYQFLLKILNTSNQNLDSFVQSSLFSRDNKDQVKLLVAEYQSVKDLCDQGSGLSEKDYNDIDSFKVRIKKAEQFGGNKRRKELTKLNREKQAIFNFQTLEKKYNLYHQRLDEMKKIANQIQYLNNATFEDIKIMIRYLKDNNYISISDNYDFDQFVKNDNSYLDNQDQDADQRDSSPKLNDIITIHKKGLIAAEISECNEIVLTEMLLNGVLEKLTQAEIIALMAAFIEEKSNNDASLSSLNITDNLREALEVMNYYAMEFGDYEAELRIDIGSDWNLYLSFVEPTYAWSSGQSIYEITNKFDGVYEGTFIRNILRIHNMLENIKNIFQTVDDPVMVKKLENIENLLLRDQVTTESLYITKE